jgi:hypothetical protein
MFIFFLALVTYLDSRKIRINENILILLKPVILTLRICCSTCQEGGAFLLSRSESEGKVSFLMEGRVSFLSDCHLLLFVYFACFFFGLLFIKYLSYHSLFLGESFINDVLFFVFHMNCEE